MADPRFTAEAERLIQDIQIYHADHKNRAVCYVMLHDGILDSNEASIDAHIFARKLERMHLQNEFEGKQFLPSMNLGRSLPLPQSAFLITSRNDNHCSSRDDAKKQGALVLYALCEATGIPPTELLEKVNVRNLPDSISAAEIEPFVIHQSKQRMH